MVGEARKAAERWMSKRFDMKHPDEEILTLNDATDLLIGYAAETREQCAQIADKALAKHLTLEGVPHDRCWMGCETLKRVAAAIRSIAQQEGE